MRVTRAYAAVALASLLGCGRIAVQAGGDGGGGGDDLATMQSNPGDGGAQSQSCDPPGTMRSCCGTGMQTCGGGEFPSWGPCLDANGNPLTCEPQPTMPDIGLPPIDPACMASATCNQAQASVYPPFAALVPPDVPQDCHNGFEVGDPNACQSGAVVYTITSKSGSRAITLDVDFATYLQPDGVVVTGVDGQGQTYTLLDTCRIQTWTAADPTGGVMRPPDQTIRQFRLALRAGTTQLRFDFGGVVSPVYLQVLGLCDFDLTPFTQAKWFQAVP